MPPLQPKPAHLGLILPLCTSSATVGLALFQYPMLHAFLAPRNPPIAGHPLSAFWAAFTKPGASLIALAPVTSAIAGLVSARWLHAHATLETTDVSRWYGVGAALAAAHFAFVPAVLPLIRRMTEAGGLGEREAEARNREDLGTWFVWHTVRTVVVDLPALWCFAEGAALSFWVI